MKQPEIIEVVEEGQIVKEREDAAQIRAQYERDSRVAVVGISFGVLHELLDLPKGYRVTHIYVDDKCCRELRIVIRSDDLKVVPEGEYPPRVPAFVFREQPTGPGRMVFKIPAELLERPPEIVAGLSTPDPTA